MAREKAMSTRKLFSLPVDLIQQIERYRFSRQIATEAEAVRNLLRRGLRFNELWSQVTGLVADGHISKDVLDTIADRIGLSWDDPDFPDTDALGERVAPADMATIARGAQILMSNPPGPMPKDDRPIVRPAGVSTNYIDDELVEAINRPGLINVCFYVFPINDKGTTYKYGVAVLVEREECRLFSDRSPLFLHLDHNRHMDEVQQVFDAAKRSGHRVYYSPDPLPHETSDLPHAEALAIVDAQPTEPLTDFSTLVELAHNFPVL
ncbi:hypothetical protein [Azospirillum sp. B4]|uniref:hypothetical protein n=1 Tax=Azospirillum sp. B4 TaxID=95605 RepID=UPI0005CAD0DC|nr:hypothetical protein [Azospirillum sp. B4]